MIITISIDTEKPLSVFDLKMLSYLQSNDTRPGGSYIAPGPSVTVIPVEEPKPQPATKPAPKKAAPPAKKPVEKPVEKPEEIEEDDLLGTQPTVEDATKKAMEFLDSQRVSELKAALSSVGVSKVSQLKDSQVAAFLEALGE